MTEPITINALLQLGGIIRFGDVTGFDDSEIIEVENDVYLVIDNDYDENESIINK